ncbi:MAG: DUF3604 domain-containing protein, partial [Desulfobulbia bacterium]
MVGKRTAYDVVCYDVAVPDEIKMITRERAYTSPIWYTPKRSTYNFISAQINKSPRVRVPNF